MGPCLQGGFAAAGYRQRNVVHGSTRVGRVPGSQVVYDVLPRCDDSYAELMHDVSGESDRIVRTAPAN